VLPDHAPGGEQAAGTLAMASGFHYRLQIKPRSGIRRPAVDVSLSPNYTYAALLFREHRHGRLHLPRPKNRTMQEYGIKEPQNQCNNTPGDRTVLAPDPCDTVKVQSSQYSRPVG